MYFTRDYKEFALKNQQEMLKMLRAHLKTHDEDVLLDRLQDWFLALLKNKTLEKYDASKCASFETYIFNVACWGASARKRAKKDSTPIEDQDLMIDEQNEKEKDLSERISEYREYLSKNGGESVGALLEVLELRIKGECFTTKEGAPLYRKHLKDFLKL